MCCMRWVGNEMLKMYDNEDTKRELYTFEPRRRNPHRPPSFGLPSSPLTVLPNSPKLLLRRPEWLLPALGGRWPLSREASLTTNGTGWVVSETE